MSQLFKRTFFITFLAVAPAIILELVSQYFQNSNKNPDATSNLIIITVILATVVIIIIATVLFIKDRFISTK